MYYSAEETNAAKIRFEREFDTLGVDRQGREAYVEKRLMAEGHLQPAEKTGCAPYPTVTLADTVTYALALDEDAFAQSCRQITKP